MAKILDRPLQDEILRILDQDFAFEETNWTPGFALQLQLRELGLNPSIQEIMSVLASLDSRGSVEFSPSKKVRNTFEGFIARITTEGHNRIHYGRPSLIG